ncbi:hypothetical protein B0I33_11589 [Prauserella shujinwangii]|uniref:Uncharacterized protein n=1 Tax=Prauserella shujinwangii TaxID=1453103 RepID=A0A2T0LKU5_9PSEU|nr:hypothetical protein B0I33_11589 [Prauserella shujinwangii]
MAGQEAGEQRAQFGGGHGGADAPVRTAAEGQPLVRGGPDGLAVPAEPSLGPEGARVPVDRSGPVRDVRAVEHGGARPDPVPGEREVRRDVPRGQHGGRVQPQALGDHGPQVGQPGQVVHLRRPVTEHGGHLPAGLRPGPRMRAARVQDPRHGRARRLVPGGDQRDHLVTHLVVGQAVAVAVAPVHQCGQHMSARLPTVLPDQRDLRVDAGVDPGPGRRGPPPPRGAQPPVQAHDLREPVDQVEQRLQVRRQRLGAARQPRSEQGPYGAPPDRRPESLVGVHPGAPVPGGHRLVGGVGHDPQVAADTAVLQRGLHQPAPPPVVRAVGHDQ